MRYIFKIIDWALLHRDKIILTVVAIACIFFLIFTDFGRDGRVVVYDCRDAHWHPDIPIEVKKACGEMFKERYQKEQESKIFI